MNTETRAAHELAIHEALMKAVEFIHAVKAASKTPDIGDLIDIQEAALDAERALGRARRAMIETIEAGI